MPMMEATPGLPVEQIESSTMSADPELLISSLVNGADVVARQTFRDLCVMAVVPDLTALDIQAIEATAECADPEGTVSVFVEGANLIVAERARIPLLVHPPTADTPLSIEFEETAIRAQPENVPRTVNHSHLSMAARRRQLAIDAIVGDLGSLAVESVEATVGANPK